MRQYLLFAFNRLQISIKKTKKSSRTATILDIESTGPGKYRPGYDTKLMYRPKIFHYLGISYNLVGITLDSRPSIAVFDHSTGGAEKYSSVLVDLCILLDLDTEFSINAISIGYEIQYRLFSSGRAAVEPRTVKI
eukprot:SAG11_NODE_8960_length_958_cov_3.736903_1_plen_135_part_00